MSEVKSFRLHVPRPTPVTRFVTDYTEEERARFREVFQPIAEHYRRRSRIASLGIVAAIFSIIIGFALPKSYAIWPGIVSICALLFTFLVSPRIPTCPACGNALGCRFGRYCPECCGELEPARWWRGPLCRSCGTLYWGKRRNFDLRVCTHCGVLLDARGL